MTVHFHDISDQAEFSATGGANAKSEQGVYQRWGKRLVDFSLVFVTLPFSVTLILLFAGLIALDGRNPFYRQDRVGMNGRIFRIWKLRSMVPDADAQLASYLAKNPEARKEWEADQKLKNDPRITRVGHLRI